MAAFTGHFWVRIASLVPMTSKVANNTLMHHVARGQDCPSDGDNLQA